MYDTVCLAGRGMLLLILALPDGFSGQVHPSLIKRACKENASLLVCLSFVNMIRIDREYLSYLFAFYVNFQLFDCLAFVIVK